MEPKNKSKDNTTSQAAADYDANVGKTIPRYELFHTETLDLVGVLQPNPESWLDVGCGTGTLVSKAAAQFSGVEFAAADPSEAMLSIAREKCAKFNIGFSAVGTEELMLPKQFDIITAIMAHHYLTKGEREQATKNCFAMLKPGGLYVTFETILPFTEFGTKAGLKRWGNAQIANGKTVEAVEKHVSRYGTELLPISVPERWQSPSRE